MAAVNYRIRSKENKDVPIKIYLSLGRKNFIEVNTGFTINPKDWSDKTKSPKQNTAVNKQTFNNLKKLESFIFDCLNSTDSFLIDKLWLKAKINECFSRIEKTDTGLVTNYIQEVIDTANTRKIKIKGGYKLGLSQSRINSFISTQNVIKEYQIKIKKQIHFIDFTETWIDKFGSWLIDDKKYAINTASKHLANLKTLCIEAERKEILVNPFAKHIIVFAEADEDRYIQTLSFEELEVIRKTELTREAHRNARNWLLIGCDFGQRGNDLLNALPSNIRLKDGRIAYIDIFQQKSQKWVTVPIVKPYVIDIVQNNFPYKISAQKLNDYIKEVCEIAGINQILEGKIMNAETGRKELKLVEKYKLITTHCFRRSFCTNYYKKISTPTLMGISGHTKESIFLKYINKHEDKDANADLFIKLYGEIYN